MDLSNSAFDQAEELAEGERQNGIKTASEALSKPGTAVCVDCDTEISEARRKAAPFATRCIECQAAREKGQVAR